MATSASHLHNINAYANPLRDYIRKSGKNYISRLRSSPCLLISSSPPPAISTAVAGTKTPSSISTDQKEQRAHQSQLKFQQQQNDPKIHAFVKRNTQSLTNEFNLRTVPCHISSAFPTLESVNEAVALAKRAGLKEGSFGSGDGVIIGVGSGSAMDLAKAVADSLFGNIDSCRDNDNDAEEKDLSEGGGALILAPSTLGGLWAASSNSPSLLLDTKEEMLLPHLTSSWGNDVQVPSRRRGTVVTLDQYEHLALPPLYTPFQPVKRSEYSSAPSMAHVAAAALVILFDVARSVDVAMKAGTINHSDWRLKHVASEIKSVSLACSSVLALAADLAMDDGTYNIEKDRHTESAQLCLFDAIPRLSPLVEQYLLLTRTSAMVTTGTIPQKLANALLPAYFPQCNIVTYLASILPGMCDALTDSYGNASEGEMSMVEEVAHAIIYCDGEEFDSDEEDNNPRESMQVSWLSSWASHLTMEAGIPTMAGLAYGTPDVNTLIGSLDSYETLVASLNGGIVSGGSVQDGNWFIEDVLRRSLNR